MVPMNGGLYLQPSLEQIRSAISEQNRPGSVDGLLAHHVLKDDPFITFDWEVNPTPEWMTSRFKPTNVEHVAALGYFQWTNASSQFTVELTDGLQRVVERDAFKGGHLSLAHNPTRLLGIILGALALLSSGGQALQWCQSVLKDIGRRGDTGFDPLIHYLFYRAFGKKIPVQSFPSGDLYQLSFLNWAIRHQMHETEPSLEQLRMARDRLLFRAATELRFESAPQAAFIWTSVNAALFSALGEASVQPRHVAGVLRNFEPAMRRWRWDANKLEKPIRWAVIQEREVQDILWLILRSYFPDAVDEDALPKFGHSTYRADFGIPSLKLIIEAKFASSKDDFKKIEKGIQEDCIPYLRDLRYESLIVFIYDDSASVQEHEITRRALLELPGVVDAVIVSRPSQLVAKLAPGRGRSTKR